MINYGCEEECLRSVFEKQTLSKTYPKGHFYVLSSPEFHLVIISTNVFEELLVNSKNSTSKGWCPEYRTYYMRTD